MYKATQSSQQFFAREAMHSTKGSRRGFDLLDQGENPVEVLNPEQRRASLVAHWKALQEQLLSFPKKHPKRIELGLQMQVVQAEISAIRPKLRLNPSVKDHFIEVARDLLSNAQYRAIMNEAASRAGSDQKKLRLMGFT